MNVVFWRPGSGEPGLDHELIWGSIGLLGLLIARLVPPVLTDWYHCPFHGATGIPCLTCGMTRAFRFTVHGRLAEAFSLNPLGTLFCLAVIAYVVYATVMVIGRLPRPRLTVESPAARWALRLGLPAAVLANWVYLYLHGV
jgi:hypothetical protein